MTCLVFNVVITITNNFILDLCNIKLEMMSTATYSV